MMLRKGSNFAKSSGAGTPPSDMAMSRTEIRASVLKTLHAKTCHNAFHGMKQERGLEHGERPVSSRPLRKTWKCSYAATSPPADNHHHPASHVPHPSTPTPLHSTPTSPPTCCFAGYLNHACFRKEKRKQNQPTLP